MAPLFGERIGWEAMAGEPEHADPQCQLAYVVRACVALFGIMVNERKVLEWTRTVGFKERPLRGQIRDRTFEKPLRARAIVDAAAADRLVAEALWAKREPYLVKLVEKGEAKGRKEGHEEGREKGREVTLQSNVKDLCGALGITWSVERDGTVKRLSLSALEKLWEHLVIHKK